MTKKICKECHFHKGLPLFRCILGYTDSICFYTRKNRYKCENYRKGRYEMRLAEIKTPLECPHMSRFRSPRKEGGELWVCELRNVPYNSKYDVLVSAYQFPEDCPLKKVEE